MKETELRRAAYIVDRLFINGYYCIYLASSNKKNRNMERKGSIYIYHKTPIQSINSENK